MEKRHVRSTGKANMWAGAFADVGVMVVAVANATRALKAE